MRATACAVTALVVLLSAGCGGSRPQGDGAQSALQGFTDRFFQSYFEFRPTEATSVGLHQFDSALESWSAADIQKRIATLHDQGAQIAQIRKQNLTEPDAIDAVILENRIAAELLDLETIRDWRRNPLMYAVIPGAAVDAIMKRDFAPAKDRVRSVNARLLQIPRLLNAMRDNCAQVPRVFAELALRIVRGSIPFFRGTVAEWVKANASGDTVLLGEFANAHRQALVALQVASDFLEGNVLPMAGDSFAIGSENFARKLAVEEMVDVPLPRLLEIGEANLERDYAAFIETARRIDSGKSAGEVMQAISADHPGENELTSFASATAERIRQFVVDKGIVPIPSDVRPSILPTPPYARAGSFASMDTPGPYETSARQAFYYVTPVEPNWTPQHKEEHLRLFSRPVMDMITVHEAWPGHYVQFLYSHQFPGKTRKLTACGTNAEGWAHYAEQMMIEQGFGGGNPKIRLAQLSEALVRDVRYIAGIRLHTQGMSVEEAKDLFVGKAFLTEANALEEARRGTYNPTYLYYTLGKLQILKLREDYAKRKGEGFSLGSFHQEFVRQGAIPIPLVRRILLPGDSGPVL
jgi:uncharacterized protein (DUF885 family)